MTNPYYTPGPPQDWPTVANETTFPERLNNFVEQRLVLQFTFVSGYYLTRASHDDIRLAGHGLSILCDGVGHAMALRRHLTFPAIPDL